MEPIAPLAAGLALGPQGNSGFQAFGFSGDPLFGGLDAAGAAAAPDVGQTEFAAAGGAVAPAFGAVLSQFLGQVDSAQHGADAMVESLALGEPVDVHQVMLALNQATDALQLTLQVRSKILDAYQAVMQTQV